MGSESANSVAQQVAFATRECQRQRTGHTPKAVNVVVSNDMIVVTMQDALSAAELVLAATAQGIAQVQEFHRQLFNSSDSSLNRDIQRITGVAVSEATAEIDTRNGDVIHVLTTGTSVQVFQLAGGLLAEAWNDAEPVPKNQ